MALEVVKRVALKWAERQLGNDLQAFSDADLRREKVYWAKDQMVATEMLAAIEQEASRRGIDLG